MNYKLTKKPTTIILLACLVVFLSLSSFIQNDYSSLQKKSLDFSGTNSLFIEYKDGLNFNWITNKKDSGYYELRDSKDKLITQGKTSFSRVHQIKIPTEIKSYLTFKFGGVNSKKHTIKLQEQKNTPILTPKNIDSIYVIGDVHGRYDKLIHLLQKSKVIDHNLNWIAGKASLVFLGDVFDRGNQVTKVLWFINQLEEKAKNAGGKVYLVLGNHEIMIMSKDLRYLSRKESSIPLAYKVTYDYLFHPKKSYLGNWLRSKKSVLKIDNALFAHGGIIDLQTKNIYEFNQKVSSYLIKPEFLDLMKKSPDTTKYKAIDWHQMKHFFYSDKSPFWYRGYVYSDTLNKQLRAMLKKYDSKIHIVAHTPLKTITEKYNGKLLTTDLNDAATELLLLVKKKKRYKKYKINSDGKISDL
tara:strand:+ start:121 stop:1356 length:1236 start_codon:yes stop_codon:yes gene_type:complete